MKMWFKKIALSLVVGLLFFAGLITAQPAHAASSNPNYTWQNMTPNLSGALTVCSCVGPHGATYNQHMLYDASTQKIIEYQTGDVPPGPTSTSYFVIDPKTQTITTLQVHLSNGSTAGAGTFSFNYASNGYINVSSGGNFIINESTGAFVSAAPATNPNNYVGSFRFYTDASGTVYFVSNLMTGSPTFSSTVYTVDPSSGNLSPTGFSNVPSYNASIFIPFSDGSGFWVTYEDTSYNYYVYNSRSGKTSKIAVSPAINSNMNYYYPSKYSPSSILTAVNNVNSNDYFITISSSGTINESFLAPTSTKLFTNPVFMDSTNVLDGSGSEFYVIPINNPTAFYDAGSGSTPSSLTSEQAVINPNTYAEITGNNDGIYALNASPATNPVLQNSTSTQSSISVKMTTPGGGTAGLTFQYSLYSSSGSLVSQSTWTGDSYTFSGLVSGTTYDFQVQTQNAFGQTSSVTDLGNLSTIPATPSNTTTTIAGAGWQTNNGMDTISLTYPAVSGATGYNVVLQDGSNVLKSFDVGNTTTPTITVPDTTHDSGLVDGSGKYEVAIQAYNTSNGQKQMSPASPTVTLAPINQTDTVAPQWGSNPVMLNNGQAYTNSQTIPIQINAMDPDSGISEILVSNDDISWTTFDVGTAAQGMTNASNYTVTSAWQLPPGGGQKSVYVKLVDLVGNTSGTQTGYVGLQVNTTPPTVSLAINNGQSQTTSQTVTLTVTAADPAYTNDQLTMSFSSDGQTWTTPVAFASSYSWTLPSSASGSYPVFVRVADPAANTGLAYSEIYYLNQSSAPTLGGSSGTTGGSIGVTFPTSGGGVGTATTTTYDGLSNVYVVQNNQVTLDFSQSGASYVSVSTDNISFSSLYDATKPFTIDLPAGDGLKTVYAQLANANNKDALGGTGKIYFLVDTTAPVLTVNAVGNATVTTGNTFQVQLDVSDNTTPLTALQVQVNGGSWSPVPANQVISLAGFQAHSGLQTYTISVKDLAGNTTTKSVTFWAA